MKRDPYKSPIRLTGGGWRYLEKGMKRPLQSASFWACAQKLAAYRAANGLQRATFDAAQQDVLCAERRRRGLGCEPSDLQTAPVTTDPVQVRKLTVEEFKKRYESKRKGGCRSCGKKR